MHKLTLSGSMSIVAKNTSRWKSNMASKNLVSGNCFIYCAKAFKSCISPSPCLFSTGKCFMSGLSLNVKILSLEKAHGTWNQQQYLNKNMNKTVQDQLHGKKRYQILIQEYWTLLGSLFHYCELLNNTSTYKEHNVTFSGNTGAPEMFQHM